MKRFTRGGAVRFCSTGQVVPEHVGEYRRRHAAVWPEVLRALHDAGWGDHTLHLREDGLLVGVVERTEVADLAEARAAMDPPALAAVNARWQQEMGAFFVSDDRPDRASTTLPRVFDLRAQLAGLPADPADPADPSGPGPETDEDTDAEDHHA